MSSSQALWILRSFLCVFQTSSFQVSWNVEACAVCAGGGLAMHGRLRCRRKGARSGGLTLSFLFSIRFMLFPSVRNLQDAQKMILLNVSNTVSKTHTMLIKLLAAKPKEILARCKLNCYRGTRETNRIAGCQICRRRTEPGIAEI